MRPTMEFANGREIIATREGVELRQDEEPEEEQHQKEMKEERCETVVLSKKLEHEEGCLGELEVNEEDDGFRTPTSEDHKIPLMKVCPPAPRKPKPCKRKAPSDICHQQLDFDLLKEIELLIPPVIAEVGRKIKKVRRKNHTD